MHTCSVSPSIMPYSSCNSWARVVSCQKQTLQMGQGRFLSKTDIADGPGSFLVKNRHCRWARVVSCQKQTLQMGQGRFLSKTDIADGPGSFLVKNRHCRWARVVSCQKQTLQMGQSCFLSKTDIADAFCIVPLHPSQYCLFGFVSREKFYYDHCLPMGCNASCKMFETLSNALQRIASSKLHIRNIAHVLDDFLLLARDKAVGQAQLSSFQSMCADIGIPIDDFRK